MTAGAGIRPMDVGKALAARRRWPALVAGMLLGVSVGVTHTALTEPAYESTTSVLLLLKRGAPPSSDAQVESYAALATSPLVLAPVIAQLQLQTTPESLARRVHAQARPDTAVLDISVTDRSARGAVRIADAVATELDRAAAEEPLRGSSGLAVRPLRTATTPTSPSSPQPVRDIGLGLVGGLMVGAVAPAAIDIARRQSRRRVVPGATTAAS